MSDKRRARHSVPTGAAAKIRGRTSLAPGTGGPDPRCLSRSRKEGGEIPSAFARINSEMQRWPKAHRRRSPRGPAGPAGPCRWCPAQRPGRRTRARM